MTPSADLSPPRRPIFFPVVIATVFLTIIGMVAGYLLGERHRRNDEASAGSTGGPSSSVAPPAQTQTMSGTQCPSAARVRAGDLGFPSDLRQVLKVQTSNGTTIWICDDYTGKLYYQSKTGGLDSPLVQDVNGLFVADVTDLGDDQYQADDGKGNTFDVTRKKVVVNKANGTVQTTTVINAQ